ncbi:MAG: metallophosphoesterase [Candidatus Eremiobacteraeota bacterium]|nr:metallophosphoesterase [Alphaproteobacteria bacterium]MBV8344876.1 metallophosphoesterase [Candidatus Eremiobacteraeota bacterium]
MIVAQISDMHIKRRGHFLHHMPHVARPLHRTLSAIARLRPDCIIATGDLTEAGTLAEYARLREILNKYTGSPIYLLPGNHDRREALRSVFWDHQYLRNSADGVLFAIERASLRIVALDSSDERRAGGYLDEARLEWLRRCLCERPNTPTILAMHHPPFPTGIRSVERQAFLGREALERIVRAHPQIRRIVCGHVHQPLANAWSGTVGVTAPSTAPTLALHSGALALSWEPGGFLIHRYEQSTGLTTTLIRVAAKPVALTA